MRTAKNGFFSLKHGESGFLVRPNDPADLAATVQEVPLRDIRPIERKARARSLDFDGRRIAQQMVAYYEELIS